MVRTIALLLIVIGLAACGVGATADDSNYIGAKCERQLSACGMFTPSCNMGLTCKPDVSTGYCICSP